jgi:transketolase
VTLFGTGMMTNNCIKAADMLLKDGIYAEVVHLASVKPIDEALIVESVQRTGCAVTAENGSVLGGFGSAVAEVLGENYPVPIKRIGVQDQWIQGGPEDDLMTFYKMQPVDIAASARASIAMKKK